MPSRIYRAPDPRSNIRRKHWHFNACWKTALINDPKSASPFAPQRLDGNVGADASMSNLHICTPVCDQPAESIAIDDNFATSLTWYSHVCHWMNLQETSSKV